MNKKLIDDFKKEWSNSRKWLKNKSLSINDVVPTGDAKGVPCCVYSAYLDACRTFNFCEEESKDRYEKRNKALKNLYDKIMKYIDSNNPAKFNHKKWSKELINDFKCCCTNMNYGKAQKIINMTFKYLYCCDDKPEDSSMFQPCHMALDQFTLKWYKEISKIYFDGWSNIENYNLYEAIQNHIRRYLAKQTKYDKNPIFAEFDIWAKYRNAYDIFEIDANTTKKQYNDKSIYINGLDKH